MVQKKLKNEEKEPSTQDCEERIAKYHPQNSISSITLLIFIVISVATAYNKLGWASKTNIADNIIKNTNHLNNITKVVEETSAKHDGPVAKQNADASTFDGDAKTKKSKAKKRISRRSRIDSITNDYDRKILDRINDGEHIFNRGHYPECISLFEKLLKRYPDSPRAMYGQAKCLDKLSEKMRSNEILGKAIEAYSEAAKQPNIPSELVKIAMLTQSERMIFFGKTRDAINVLAKLTERMPNEVEVLNKLGHAYLIMNSNRKAYDIHMQVLKLDPSNGLASANIGYILKASKKFNLAIPYLQQGIESGEKETSAAKFYIFLGEAYTKTGRSDEAWKLYHQGAEKGIFLSAAQRSTENAESKLRAQPWWSIEDTGYEKEIRKLEYYWKTMRDEALHLLKENKDKFPLENEGLLHKGDWRQFEIYTRGRQVKKNCLLAPKTCEIISQLKAATGNTRGQIKFSIMEPGTHVWPHTGPTNCRLRAHLGLVVPKGVEIRVGSQKRKWENGKVLIFDDSFDHEVWHNGMESRLILIIDFWHPDLPSWERQSLHPV